MVQTHRQDKNKGRHQPGKVFSDLMILVARASLCAPPERGRPSQREWMGVEPTVATSAVPTTDFEDRGAHRDTSTPKQTGA